jgi:SCY1-like protein 2
MKTIHDLTKRVEEAHIRHLKEIKSLEEQTKNVSANASPQPAAMVTTTDTNISFESLVGGGKNGNEEKGNDMFGSMLNPDNITNNQQSTWSAQPIIPKSSTSNNMNKSWSPSSPQQSTTSSWNTQKPLTPISSSSINQTSLSNGMGSMNLNTNTGAAGWSHTIQPINQRHQQQIPSINSPPSFQNTPTNNLNHSTSNYNALKRLSSNITPHTMMPLSPTMGLLKPTTASSSNNLPNNTPKLTKPNNLQAFDPLA